MEHARGAALKFIDISMTLRSGMTTYAGDVAFSRREMKSIEAGDPLNLSELTMGAHTGTHVDAPYHFLREGPGTHELPPDAFSGPARVLPLEHVSKAVEAKELSPFPLRRGEIALLKTSNSKRLGSPFRTDYVYLSEDGAKYISDLRLKAVGIDYLSIEGFHVKGFPVHRLLLESGVGIIEGLNLSSVGPGEYWLLCLPLSVEGGDGSPARAVLVEGWP